MGIRYAKSEIMEKVELYFKRKDCKNLYKDDCINYTGETKDTKENYSKVIVDYLVEHSEEFKQNFYNIIVTRRESYKTEGHDGISTFDFYKHPKGERREEIIAHAMYCQYKDKPAVFGKILDYQVTLKNTNEDNGLGKIDLLSVIDSSDSERQKVYFLELKKDSSPETLLRCILEAYTYSRIIDKEKLCKDFSLVYDKCDFVIAPLVYKLDGFEQQMKVVEPLINSLGIPVEIFTWEHNSDGYRIESQKHL